ncbi:unnamed protein product (macronuclear) [Paramecium tetraurelia]|uniref:Poly(A) RNA polymerase mitochondrial-like central palm domain-containing protein n=1 Tax=Paramecium tetraurelia TaxID=5888 RepID=A0DQY9_PARTE|nr:uncharacterized protein GSPATT00002857001 [Paramecium tetraurelia]CAK85456.1 unnamed protein product [Paramecium tetraurelia]|eukprot:XP_001452853.1 hypothetical protein (macronuclear) [Paramecium tetraurelia strain d4-2]
MQYNYNQDFEDQLLNLINQEIPNTLLLSLEALAKALKMTKLKGALYPFGSYCNGFGSEIKDLDCVFLTPCDDKSSSLLRQVHAGIRDYNHQNLQPTLQVQAHITHAKVPIIKLVDTTNNVEIDLSVNNINGIANSKLLYEYSQLHPKIKQMGLLLKLWGKRNRLIKTGSLTSYSIIIFMIHFLQVKYKVPYLSDFQLSEQQLKDLEHLENNPFFSIGLKVDLPELTQTSLQQLLYEFFLYYQPKGEFELKNICISIHRVPIQNVHPNFTLKIQDPINMRQDPSKRFEHQCCEFQNAFLKAKILIQQHDIRAFDKNDIQKNKGSQGNKGHQQVQQF